MRGGRLGKLEGIEIERTGEEKKGKREQERTGMSRFLRKKAEATAHSESNLAGACG